MDKFIIAVSYIFHHFLQIGWEPVPDVPETAWVTTYKIIQT
jgi:hypothetical protein